LEEKFLTPKEAAKILGVHPLTLYRWAKAGKIRYITTPGGRFRYPLSEIKRILGSHGMDLETEHKAVIYIRVSPGKKLENNQLNREIDELKKLARKKGLDIVDIIIDHSHGYCVKTPSILKLLDLVKNKKIKKIIIPNDMTFSNTCSWVYHELFNAFGVEVIVAKRPYKIFSDPYLEMIELINEVLKKEEIR